MTEPVLLQKKNAFQGWPMVIFWVGMLVFALHSSTRMVAAGDTWVALACGRHFINHGVDTVEPFSANSHSSGPTKETMETFANRLRQDSYGETGIKAKLMGWYADKAENYESWSPRMKSFANWIHPTGWVNQNWLTHTIFYWLAKNFGSAFCLTYIFFIV